MLLKLTNDILPKQILDIADGSDEIYGEGVSIEHTEGGQSDARFVSGGIDHTHQYIVANALLVLEMIFDLECLQH